LRRGLPENLYTRGCHYHERARTPLELVVLHQVPGSVFESEHAAIVAIATVAIANPLAASVRNEEPVALERLNKSSNM